MDVKIAQLLWRCGLRLHRWPDGRTEWKAVIATPGYVRSEELRPIQPSRLAIRNAARRLSRLKGSHVVTQIMRRFGVRKNLDNVPKRRWGELYRVLEDEAYALQEQKPST